MKINPRMWMLALTIILLGTVWAIPVSANCAYDAFTEYDQLTFEMSGTTVAPTMDGIVSEGEYGQAMITVKPGDTGTFMSNWSNESNPLSDAEFAELMPEQVTFYLTYDETYLYLAAEVVEDMLYSTCDQPQNLWGTENMEFDIGVNPLTGTDEYAEDVWTRTEAMDRVTVCVGLTDFQDGKGPTEAALIGGTSMYTDYYAWQSVEGVGVTRDEEARLTTYECTLSWKNIYRGEAVPEVISLRYQLYIADGDYLDHVTPGYVNALGTFRFYGTLTADEQATTGAAGSAFPHIAVLKDAAAMNDGTFRDTAETEPVETEPAETEPVETEPVETEPVETTPTDTEPFETVPAETAPTETDSVGTQATGTDSAGSDAPDEDKGCASSIGIGSVSALAVGGVSALCVLCMLSFCRKKDEA